MNRKYIDLRVVAFQITYGSPDIRSSSEYEKYSNLYMDRTMSCTPKEAFTWLRHWMMEAISEGNGQKNFDLRCRFLAAYDLSLGIKI